jgi:hypothetical protein
VSDSDLHELITRAIRSYSLLRVTFSNDAQEGGTVVFQTIALGVGVLLVGRIWDQSRER